MEEKELAAQCGKNDRKAQHRLFELHSDRLYRVCQRYLRVDTDSEDVLIVGFGKIFQNIGSFIYREKGSLEAWMKKVIINECLMHLRQQHNFNLTETLDDRLEEPDLRGVSTLDAEAIYNAIALLPTGYRTVFNLFVVEGYRHDEIAGQLGISEGTSRSQLFKAKSILKEMLTKEGFEYGT